MNIQSFDRSVKSWQFLGMIHVISFNSTGVGVYIQFNMKQSWILFSIFFKQKLHGIIWALLLPSQHFVHGHLNGASNIDLHSPTVIPLLWFFAWLSLLSWTKHHCVGMHEWMEQRLVGYCKLATSTHLYCITPEFIYITGLD